MRANKYAGACALCGVAVAIAAGRLIGLPGSWRTICLGCSPKPPPHGDHDGWHLAPMASLDLETTGTDPLVDRILSFALLGDRSVDVCGLVDAGVDIPEAASAVNGLTAEALAGAPQPVEAVGLIVQWLDDLIERGVGLVVYNAAYDLTMVRAEAARWGVRQPDWQRLLVVDPFVIDWGIERGGLGPRRLSDVAAYYGVALTDAHDATADARAARSIASEIGLRHPQVAEGTLDDLMERQRAWFADRADDWNQYARRVGRTLDDPLGWPLARLGAEPLVSA